MKPRHFLTSLLAINLSFHFLRFPHLIIENGGGAFLILFFIVLNALALPLMISERVLDDKLAEIDLKSLISIHKFEGSRRVDQFLVRGWYGFRLLFLVFFLWFFLYLAGSSVVYFFYFFSFLSDSRVNTTDLPSTPDLELGLVGSLLITALSFFVYRNARNFFFQFSNQWILPMVFCILLFLFLKVIIGVQDFQALKILFYPDFSALNRNSAISLVGHSMVCLFIGFGFYQNLKDTSEDNDPIEIFIHALIQTLCLAVVIGIMALPMIQQVSETAFGFNWVFSILPRWLSYGKFGTYYCCVFFLAIFLLGFHISVILLDLLGNIKNHLVPPKDQWKFPKLIDALFVALSGGMVFLLQRSTRGWSGQSFLLWLDYTFINVFLPALGLIMIWVVFRYTKPSEQIKVFEYQKVFYHNRVFFKIWRFFSVIIVPLMVLSAWSISLYFKGN